MTNSLAIVLVVVTNWITIGYYTDLSGKRYEDQAQRICTNTIVRQVTICTNDVSIRTDMSETNGVTRRVPILPPPLPMQPR